MKEINFFNSSLKKIFTEKKLIIDIGGGLRLVREKNNRYDPKREWLRRYLDKVDYKILDPIDDYHPDIVGDIHYLPFEDNSIDAILCLAVLEHVENPIKASQELFRVLKPGGYALIYVPFLYYYHAEKGYYKDYWRFTKDALNLLFEPFAEVEIEALHGAVETWIKLSPLGRFRILRLTAACLDVWLGKKKSNQVSGYNVFLVK